MIFCEKSNTEEAMAEGDGSSNTAIVAIVVLVIILGAGLYFLGVFNPQGEKSTTVIEKPTIIEKPSHK